MLIITDAAGLTRALHSMLDPAIKQLLTVRRNQLLADTNGEYGIGELAHWIVVEPGDTLAAVSMSVGFPITPDPPWEWVLDHSGIYEAPVVTSDSGFGIVLIMSDEQGIDPALLTLLRCDAVPATPSPDGPPSHANTAV